MPLIKHHCKKRNKNFKKEDKHDLQESIDNLIWKNQMQSIHRENRKQVTGSKKCWDKSWWTRSQGESAVASVSSALSPSVINCYFKEINTDTAYSLLLSRFPCYSDLFIQALEPCTVERFLAKQEHKTSSSERLPYWIWQHFSHPLDLVIVKLFNRSISALAVHGNLPMWSLLQRNHP